MEKVNSVLSEIKLELSHSKTKITHLRKRFVHFLGTDIKRPGNFESKNVVSKILRGKVKKTRTHVRLTINAP